MQINSTKEKKYMKRGARRGRPKKAVKYTKTINVRLTQSQWLKVLNAAEKSYLEPSVFIRKTVLDSLAKPEK
jgi:hypothetical protein